MWRCAQSQLELQRPVVNRLRVFDKGGIRWQTTLLRPTNLLSKSVWSICCPAWRIITLWHTLYVLVLHRYRCMDCTWCELWFILNFILSIMIHILGFFFPASWMNHRIVGKNSHFYHSTFQPWIASNSWISAANDKNCWGLGCNNLSAWQESTKSCQITKQIKRLPPM